MGTEFSLTFQSPGCILQGDWPIPDKFPPPQILPGEHLPTLHPHDGLAVRPGVDFIQACLFLILANFAVHCSDDFLHQVQRLHQIFLFLVIFCRRKGELPSSSSSCKPSSSLVNRFPLPDPPRHFSQHVLQHRGSACFTHVQWPKFIWKSGQLVANRPDLLPQILP